MRILVGFDETRILAGFDAGFQPEGYQSQSDPPSSFLQAAQSLL